ncbi:MAG: recombinase family protein, partial [Acidobacteria bacterium]|nr:recombinase family protein [Acidobacteriota bacterium]
SEIEIANELNQDAIPNEFGRPWTRGTIHQILTNEKYIGNNIYNRMSFKLKEKRVHNPPDMWVRALNVFESIVDEDLFAAARRIIDRRSRRLTDSEMLEQLTSLLTNKKRLSGLIIDEVEDMPSSSIYRERFGSLIRAYQLIGYNPGRDYHYVEINRALRTLYPQIVGQTMDQIQRVGGSVELNPLTDILTINEEFTVSIVIARCFRSRTGFLRWKLRLDSSLRPDITIAVRMNADNQGILDYYVLPIIDIAEHKFSLAEENGAYLDVYRSENLDVLFCLSARHDLGVAA